MENRAARELQGIALACAIAHEGDAPVCRFARRSPRFALLLAALFIALPGVVHAEPTILPPDLSAAPPAAPAYSTTTLAALIDVPDLAPTRFQPQDPDEAMEAAVAKGTNPDLEPLKPFRKKNFDLFRTTRKVEIGNQEMQLRFRLRAKSKETVSVELRF